MATKKTFKCSKCDRVFSMPAHLARHMNTIHAPKKRVIKKKAAKRAQGKAVRRAAPVPAVRRTILDEAVRVIGDIRSYRDALAAQRRDLDSQIQAVEGALLAMGATSETPARGGPQRRAGAGLRRGSLKDYIGRVLRGRSRAMAVKNITAAVLKTGYKSTNKTLDKSVGIALASMPGVTKVARGEYKLM